MLKVINRATAQLMMLMIVSILGACVVVPGSNIDTRDHSSETGLSAADRQLSVDVYEITPQLIANQILLNNQVQPGVSPELLDEIAEYQYLVSRGDVLQITVYEYPELNSLSGGSNERRGITVENDGSIFYPYIGQAFVAGLTIGQLREEITNSLGRFLMTPQVTVDVIEYNARRAYVTGQVRTPGAQPINNLPLTLLDAIANAGGLTDNANWHEVLLSRNGTETRVSVYEMLNHGRLGQNRVLQHGDVVHVPEVGPRQVFVMGELNQVNTLPMGNMSLSLTEALTRSGGLNQITSNAKGIFVIRPSGAAEDKLANIYQLNVSNAVTFTLATQFQLQPSDIVYVTTAPVTRWNRVISQLLPSLTALFAAESVGNL